MVEQDGLDDTVLKIWRDFETGRANIRFRNRTRVNVSGRRERIFTFYEIINQSTGDHHHYALKIETIKKLKGVFELAVPDSVSLSEDTGQELTRLKQFLDVCLANEMPEATGSYLVVPESERFDGRFLGKVVSTMSDEQSAELLIDLVDKLSDDPETLKELMRKEKEDPTGFERSAAMINLARYSNALQELEYLVEQSNSEGEFQRLLTANPWMFGSEYSELLPRRRFVRDSNLDFMMRRTSDGYVEIVEIKTPLRGRGLFQYDPSHDCFHPSSELSKVIGQVVHYIEGLDAERFLIQGKDKEDVNKIRAKIIVGRNGREGCQNALRSLNGHLHRIEILTYDQLIQIAYQVVELIRKPLQAPVVDRLDEGRTNSDDDIPF